ncbi:MAG: hypothetical protein AB7L94_19475 [Kofleriaceae bacterium]
MSQRVKLAIACAASGLVVMVLVLVSPLRHISGDTVPNRAGAVALRCAGTLDLARIEWIEKLERVGRVPYWGQVHDDAVYSVFGPAPALVGALVMPALDEGDVIDDATMRRRERTASAALLALSVALVILAAAARVSIATSVATGAVCACSFAGMATIGQGLWQASVALPLLAGALASLAWAPRSNAARVIAPALLVAAVLARPAIAPLVAGLGLAWCVQRPTRNQWLIASGLAITAAAPFVIWHLVALGTPLPTGQLAANAHVSNEVFVLSRAQIGLGVGGLIASPARGLIWFAPIVILVVVIALRRGDGFARVVAGAIVLQVLVFGLFHMWWGGICFGPRFLAEAVWVGVWLGTRIELAPRWLAGVAVAATVVVGQMGLWGWRAEQWETRRNPDIDQSALWDFRDSPIPAILVEDADEQLLAVDAIGTPRALECRDGRLRDVQ